MSTRLLDEMRDLMRRRHYSIHTERAYRDWVKRYVRFHDMQSRDDLRPGEEKIEAFLTHLARDRQVAASTQNQAMNALVFLYKHVLKQPLSGKINADRARRRVKIPVVLTREETARVIALMSEVHQLIVKLLYGSGLRITECVRLRVQDVDLEMKALSVRSGNESGPYHDVPRYARTAPEKTPRTRGLDHLHPSRTGTAMAHWPTARRVTRDVGMSRIGTLHCRHASLVRSADSDRREVADRSDVNENPGCRRSAAAPGSPASTALRRRCGPRPTRTGAFRSRRGTTPSAPAPRARRTPASRPPR